MILFRVDAAPASSAQSGSPPAYQIVQQQHSADNGACNVQRLPPVRGIKHLHSQHASGQTEDLRVALYACPVEHMQM